MAALSLFWNTNMASVTSCENTLCLFWAPNGLNELPEMRFEFPLILIGPKRTKWTTGNAFWISFNSAWQKIVNGFFSRPIMARTQMLVRRWGPKKGFRRCFADGLHAQAKSTPEIVKRACSQPNRRQVIVILVVLSFVGFRPCGLRQNSTSCADGAYVRLPVHQDVHTGKHDWIYWECEMSNH